ncbi:MAG: type I-D CRISPR-associated helicase Cas3' [Caldilineaceae bacterium]
MRIHTLPVYSKLADEIPTELQQMLPTEWHLSQHQVETYRALTDLQGPDVIINTAMTGDGKSLAGQLPALVNGWRVPLFSMYPTNELIRDQLRQAQSTWQRWQQSPTQIRLLDSSELDRIMESKDYGQRGEALLSALQNSEILLTNPDIFHYIMQTFYRRQGKKGDAPDRIIGPLLDLYNQFTFDEFHIFETPQVVSVLNAMLFIHEMVGKQRKRFLFQSATPGDLMQTYLERAGLRHSVIRGQYAHSYEELTQNRWRKFCKAVTFI